MVRLPSLPLSTGPGRASLAPSPGAATSPRERSFSAAAESAGGKAAIEKVLKEAWLHFRWRRVKRTKVVEILEAKLRD